MRGLTLGLGFTKAQAVPTILEMPEDFRWNPDFNIYESGRVYSTDFDFPAIKPTGTTAHITKSGNDTTGDGSEGNPYRTLAKAYTEGFSIFMIGAGVWNRTDGFAANFNPARSVALISADGPGAEILPRQATGLTCTQQAAPNDDVYVATRSSVRAILDLTFAGVSGETLKDGVTLVPIKASTQSSVANCQANLHSMWQDGSNLYFRAWDGRAPDSNILVLLIENIWAPTNSVDIWVDGCEMWGDSSARHNPAADNTNFWAWRNSAARFSGSSADGLDINNLDYCYSISCDVTDNVGNADGFNYHSDQVGLTTRTKALEYNCVAKRNGLSGQSNNNGTTAHDNCSVIRLNGNYQVSYGPLVADTLGAHSLNLGCTAGNSQSALSNGQKAAFQSGGASTIDATNTMMWIKNCTGVGSNYARVQATGGDFYDYGGFIDQTSGAQSGDSGTITPL